MPWKMIEWSAAQQFCVTASALSLVPALLGDETDHPLQVKRPAMSSTEVVKLDVGGSFVRGEASPKVEFCLENGPFPVYEREGPQVPKAKKVASEERKLSMSMISIGKTIGKSRRALGALRKTEYEKLKKKS